MRKKAAPAAGHSSRCAAAPHASRSKLAIAIAASLSGSAALHVPPARAADAAAPAEGTALEEVVVTARKRTENLQDVPISMSVFSSKDLQDRDISQFEDYATITPSISFVSAGPGTQTLVMRGVSDGSNSNYSNESLVLFMVDDMSMSFYSTTPDLHLYDIERIEVLNGPQGTTFGAGSMGGALRFITNKPDPTAFSAGVDTDVGKIDGGTKNSVVEAYANLPVIPDWTAVRLSVYDDYHGGYITNVLDTRNWVNGTVSNNAQWAGRDYNTEKVEGGRIAIGQKIADGWKATLTGSYQSQLTHGAWDEDPSIGGAVNSVTGALVNGPVRAEPPDTVVRFGPEFKQYYTKTMDFHLDGDVGIGDLVYANTWWAQDDRWVNEYSEYMQYVNVSPSFNATTQQAFDCLTDPINGSGFSGCKTPIQYYDYITHTDRWSNELRLQSKGGGWFHWLIGGYWEKTREFIDDYYHMPGLQVNGQQYQAFASYYGQTMPPPEPDDWFSYVERFDYLQVTEFTNEVFDILPTLHLELGTEHFHSTQNTSMYGGYWYSPQSPADQGASSNKWNSKVDLSYNVSKSALLYVDVAQGFRDGGVNVGLPSTCITGSKLQGTTGGASLEFKPDSLTNYEFGYKTAWLDGHLVWNGAFYYMPWHNLQSLVFDPDVCAAASFTANIGDAQVYGTESEVKYQTNVGWSFDAMASYNDSRDRTDTYYNSGFQVTPGERLPYVPYFNWSGNARYETALKQTLHWYGQYDAEHKGDMWNDLQANGYNGLPRVLQPGYTIMNLRFGLTETEQHWLAELYCTNLTDKNAVIYTNEGNYDLRYTRNEPRVVGLRFSYRWGKPTAPAE
ncbi:MAG TPA: TonB-dependent receptor [Steroidobacteraceae bacterium]|nr:TonB-dependent receptor [Steroidobacteraceae bacterium]